MACAGKNKHKQLMATQKAEWSRIITLSSALWAETAQESR
jgi:hypothetical protein